MITDFIPVVTIKKPTDPNSTEKPKRYYPVPPPIRLNVTEYQDVGKDMNLRKDITTYYHKHIIEWIMKNPNFKHHKKHLSFLKGKNGYKYVYYLLRLFVKKGKANWYDLRDTKNADTIKDYFRFKIGSL